MMSENHRANATTHTTDRTADDRLTDNDFTLDATSSWRTQPATVVFWLGPPLQAVYAGMGLSLTLHRHYATQISISLGSPLRVRTSARKPYSEQQSFIVGPHVPHQVEATETPVFEIWSEARALADLARRLSTTAASEHPGLPSDLLNDLLPVLLAAGRQVLNKQVGQDLISQILTQLLGPTWNEGSGDPRIATARSLVTPQFLAQQSQPIASLAAHVHLSPSRFRHLWRYEMDMSVQSYLRWQRLLTAMIASVHGASLTEAAHTAGFADSAHLTRVFRATFGMPPSRVFKNSHAVQVIPGDPC